jgi:hypothetical protein
VTGPITASLLLAALRQKHASDAVVREVVIDDPFEEGIRFRDRIDRYSKQSQSPDDHFALWIESERKRAESRGITIPESVPAGWNLRASIPRRRIDALIIASTGRTAVEIKVTRADFRRETDEKRRAWRAITHRFVYLVPKGLVSPAEVPDGCGLWEFDVDVHGEYRWQHGITTAKRAVLNKQPDPLPFQITQALAYRVSAHERSAST